MWQGVRSRGSDQASAHSISLISSNTRKFFGSNFNKTIWYMRNKVGLGAAAAGSADAASGAAAGAAVSAASASTASVVTPLRHVSVCLDKSQQDNI